MRKIGNVMIVLGVICIMAAVALYTYNEWDARRAQTASADVLDELQYSIEQNNGGISAPIKGGSDLLRMDILEQRQMTVVEIDGYGYIGYLSIPSIGLALPVMAECTNRGLKIAPCRYSGSLFTEDLVICAHNYARHFSPIKWLNKGVRVEFVDMDNRQWLYDVVDTEIVNPTDVELMTGTDGEEKTWDLTLFTCTTGGRTRFALRCKRVDE